MATANVESPAALDARISELEDLRQLMNGLMSTLSHDLRAPLSAISGWLYLLESEKIDTAGRKRALERIRASIDEQARLIDDVLLVSRCKSGHLQVESAAISPYSPLLAAIEELRPIALSTSVELRAPLVKQNARVIADSARLRRVFEILIAHAVKSTPTGGVIDVATYATDAEFAITITDSGKGMTATELSTAFYPFSENGSAGNTNPAVNCSLMLARILVEIQNGQLRANSRGPGLGTAFTVLLPVIAG